MNTFNEILLNQKTENFKSNRSLENLFPLIVNNSFPVSSYLSPMCKTIDGS